MQTLVLFCKHYPLSDFTVANPHDRKCPVLIMRKCTAQGSTFTSLCNHHTVHHGTFPSPQAETLDPLHNTHLPTLAQATATLFLSL